MKYIASIILFFASSSFVIAQGFYNKGATVSIASQTIFTLPDSLVNTGTLINNGDLTIAGSWVNMGTYSAGAGQINFDNDEPQTINHSDQSMGRLLINGGGEKRFLANITILTSLELQDGILVSGNGAKIILQQGATVTGGSDDSHINGPIEHRGAGNWLFPIGNGNLYLPVEITNVSDASSAATLALVESGTNANPSFPFAKFSENRYWDLTVTGGSLVQSKINLPVRNEQTLTDDNAFLVVAGTNDVAGPYSDLGQSSFSGTMSSGSIVSEQPPVFRFFTLGAIATDPTIEVFNAVSPNDDGKNDFMEIRNIERYPNNTVIIFNRWGDKVFETRGYDNNKNNFRGESNITGKILADGTYFYTIDLKDGTSKKTGFVVVK